MSKINNKLIFVLTILAFISSIYLALPTSVSAVTVRTGAVFTPQQYDGGYNNNNNYYYGYNNYQTVNPVPVITALSPNYTNIGRSGTTVTVTGYGFIPSSIVRKNGSEYMTTFYVDPNHLSVVLGANDVTGSSGYYVTVYNAGPGGGTSNAAFFTIYPNVAGPTNNTNNTTNTTTTTNTTLTKTTKTNTVAKATTDKNTYSGLAANAIFGAGTNTFLPCGLIQWLLFAILVFLIIILWRTAHAKEKYMSEPLKHA